MLAMHEFWCVFCALWMNDLSESVSRIIEMFFRSQYALGSVEICPEVEELGNGGSR